MSNGIFAYETNGLGSQYLMDDANVPVSFYETLVFTLILTDPAPVAFIVTIPWIFE